jgi:hypothetical protein
MTAGRTIAAGGSDCDDHTILLCALLSSLGFQTGAKIISPDGQSWHIYAVVGAFPFTDPHSLVALDTTQSEAYPGWEPSFLQRKTEYLCTFRGGTAVGLKQVR